MKAFKGQIRLASTASGMMGKAFPGKNFANHEELYRFSTEKVRHRQKISFNC